MSFADIFESLRMRNKFEVFTPLLIQHIERTQLHLSRFLGFLAQVEPLLTTALLELSEENQARLVCSPYMSELLVLWHETENQESKQIFYGKILRSLVAEVKNTNPDFTHKVEPVWTINGDRILDPHIEKQFPVLYTKCGILINYQSYAHNTNREGVGGYSAELGQKHKERIETGRDIIQKCSPAANSLVETYLMIIQFRQNLDRPNVVNSSHHRSIGVIYCDNFHKIHGDMPEIVDMLVHECIHQHLHLFEEQVLGFLMPDTPMDLLSQRIFASPWSGKKLDISSYTHAILVWMGLIHFWTQFLEAGEWHPEVGPKEAKDKLQEAYFGFQNSVSVLDNLGEARKYLNPIYMDCVLKEEKNVKWKQLNGKQDALCG